MLKNMKLVSLENCLSTYTISDWSNLYVFEWGKKRQDNPDVTNTQMDHVAQ